MDTLVYRKLKDILLIIVLMCFIGMTVKSCNQTEKINELFVTKQTIYTELAVSQKKLHQEISKNQIIDNISIQDFIRINAMNESILALREEVAKQQELIASTETTINEFKEFAKKDNESRTEFITKLKAPKAQPSLTVNNKWMTMNAADTFITNDYDVSIGFEKPKFLKDRKPFAVVKNHNPYANPLELKTYNVNMPKDKRFGVGVTVGYSITNQFRPSYFVGVGVNYNIIKF